MSTPIPHHPVTPNVADVPPAPPEAHPRAGESDTGLSATYSPDDNKLRLYAATRLDTPTYERLKAAGFRFAPKQDCFVAPAWSPDREDLLIELCGEIGDDDTSLIERAEARAERFETYAVHRQVESDAAQRAVAALADAIPLGQPILVGHHSERRARRDAERIEAGMRRTVSLWETARYWEDRAAGAVRAAKYKEREDVRARRIKTLEADMRKQQRTIEEAQRWLTAWESPCPTLERASLLASRCHLSQCFPLADYPTTPPATQYEGTMSLWSALDGGVITAEQARDIALRRYPAIIDHAQRWVVHYERRIAYERAMLNAQGGLAADRFTIEPGGRVLVGGSWVTVLRVNRRGGAIASVTTHRRYVPVVGIEEVQDYRAPEPGAAEQVITATALAPLCNFPGEGFLEMTAAEWKRKPEDYKRTRLAPATDTHGAYRYRTAVIPGTGYKTAQVYITDAKRRDPPEKHPTAPTTLPAPTLVLPTAPTEPRSASSQGDVQGREAIDALRETLRAGVRVVSVPQLFPTPAAVARRMVDLAGLQPGMRVLEPSAGTGVLLSAFPGIVPFRIQPRQTALHVVAVESHRVLAEQLRESGLAHEVHCADFLMLALGPFDRVLMNPPFENAVDIRHIRHALSMLAPGGRLVAIAAAGPRQIAELQPLVTACDGHWEPLPPGTFEGTDVRTVLLTVDRPAVAVPESAS